MLNFVFIFNFQLELSNFLFNNALEMFMYLYLTVSSLGWFRFPTQKNLLLTINYKPKRGKKTKKQESFDLLNFSVGAFGLS